MPSTREKGLLVNITKHCLKIKEKMVGLSREQFEKDENVFQIICFNILQIGELAKNFTETFINTYNKVPWQQIKGMRDKVAHGYGTIDVDKVWLAALEDIDPC